MSRTKRSAKEMAAEYAAKAEAAQQRAAKKKASLEKELVVLYARHDRIAASIEKAEAELRELNDADDVEA